MAPEIPAPLPGPAVPQEPAAGNTAVPAATPVPARPARPGRPQVWLLAAAGGLGVLAGAAATVSYAAQYRLVDAARHLALAAALEAAIPDAAALVFACLGVALALQGRRAIRARLLNVAVGGRVGVHERDRGRAGLAERRGVGDASGRLRAGERHADRGCPHQHRRPPPGRRGAGPGRRGFPPGRTRRAGPVAAAAEPGPAVDHGRVPRVGDRGVPGRPRPPRRPPCPAGPPGQVVPGTTCRTTGRQPTAAATNAAPPERPRAVRRRAPALFPARPVRRGASPGAARPRPPGSWRSSPRSTGRWPASPWHRWRGSAPCPPPWSA